MLSVYKPALTHRGQLDEMAPAIGGVARADDQTIRLQGVENPHEVARVDPKLGTELVLGERPGLMQVVKNGELVSSHLERRQSLAQPVARHPGEAKDQDGGPGPPSPSRDSRVGR